jgi:Flagellar hook-length control protein FliK
MLNKVDTASITPISKITPVLAVEPVATLIQSLGDRAAQFVKGQAYTAQVLSQAGDGTYTVKVEVDGGFKDTLIKMDLGKWDTGLAAKPGQTLLLRYLHDNPAPTFLSLSTASSVAVNTAEISPTAQLIGNILSQADSEGLPTRFEANAVVTHAPNNAQIVAHDLKHAIKSSGLFYESHLHDLVQNNQTLAAIRQEPQNQANPPLTNLMAQQLAILENQHLSWQGQVWPGQKMDWDVYLYQDTAEDATEHNRQHFLGQQEAIENRPISSEMTLHLPNLDKVTARLSLAYGRMRIGLLAEQTQTLVALKDSRQALAKAIEKNGQQLDALTVSHHE